MAKQSRRSPSSHGTRSPNRQSQADEALSARRAAGNPTVIARNSASDAPGPSPSSRPGYLEAVALYEQALRTLQQHNFAKAADLLRRMIETFPEERELVERSRVYLTVCERHLQPLTAEPQNIGERLYAATLALNAGEVQVAINHLDRILHEHPGHDQALYMLAVSYVQRDQPADAIRYLQQAIEANPENRALARIDPDLDDLRDDDAVSALLEPPSAMRAADPKRPARRR